MRSVILIASAFASAAVFVKYLSQQEKADLEQAHVYAGEASVSASLSRKEESKVRHTTDQAIIDRINNQNRTPHQAKANTALGNRNLFLKLIRNDSRDFKYSSLNSYLENDPGFIVDLADLFLESSDVKVRNKLKGVIDSVSSVELLDYSQELTASMDADHRQLAYSWLVRMSSVFPEAVETLISASQIEYDPYAIMGITSAISEAIPSDSKDNFLVQEHLRQMAHHNDIYVASHAMELLSSRVQDETTMGIVKSHLKSSSMRLKQTALEALGNFKRADSDVVQILDSLSKNDGERSYIRHMAANLKIKFSEDYPLSEG